MGFATIGVLATSSRMLWAFARENGLPGSSYISRVNSRLSGYVCDWTDKSDSPGGPRNVTSNMVDRGFRSDQPTPRPHQHRVERRVQRLHRSHGSSILLILHNRRLRHVMETPDNTSFGFSMGPFQTRPLWRSDHPDLYCV